jgi:hypothetical protein
MPRCPLQCSSTLFGVLPDGTRASDLRVQCVYSQNTCTAREYPHTFFTDQDPTLEWKTLIFAVDVTQGVLVAGALRGK